MGAGDTETLAAEFTVREDRRTVDMLPVSFGVRTVRVEPERGFLLNGIPLKLRRACLHHDNGLLGASAFPDANLLRVRLMKANGFNAIRTSHNPPSAAFLDACDREGMLVIDEFTDKHGARAPDAALPITCRITGEAGLQALGTGNPDQIESVTD